MERAGGVTPEGTPDGKEPRGVSRKALAIRWASGPCGHRPGVAQARFGCRRGRRSSRSGILVGERVNLKLIIQRVDRCQQWLQLLQDCLPFWGAVHHCLADDVKRIQLKAQFSQALVAGIHRVTHNSPQDADPVGQLATVHKGKGEQDLAGVQTMETLQADAAGEGQNITSAGKKKRFQV